MVGVAGKSKGCSTCRKRKIRCDLQRPPCGQCLKAGRSCGGYENPRIFLHTTARHFEQDLKVSAAGNELSSNGLGLQPLIVEERPVQHTVPSSSHIGPVSAVDYRPACHDQALSTFLNYSIPPGSADEEIPLSWLQSVAAMPKQTMMLPLAASALSYGLIGRIAKQREIINNSHQLYSEAMQSLRRALQNQRQLINTETLATMETLALYEMLESGIESSHGWSVHMAGISRLMQLRGPQMHIAGLGQQLFLFYRTIACLGSLTHRKSIFLSRSEWLHIPWTFKARKNIFHQFLDMAVQVPSFLEQIDSASGDDAPQDCHELLKKSLAHLKEMQVWGVRHDFPSRPVTAERPLPQVNTLHLRVLQHSNHGYPSAEPHSLSLSFEEIQRARTRLFYYATVLTLYSAIVQHPLFSEQPLDLQQNLSIRSHHSSQSSSTHAEPQDPTAQPEQFLDFGTNLAALITQHVDLAAQDAWRSFGPAIAIFSLKTAIDWYDFVALESHGARAHASDANLRDGNNDDEEDPETNPLPELHQTPIQSQRQRCATLLSKLRNQTRRPF